MIIGTFKYDADTNTYTGDLNTLTLHRAGVQLKPVEKGGDKEPDYRMSGGKGAAAVELGAAWKRTSEKGQDFLSVVLDDPALDAPINAALFLKDGTAQLVWSRPAKKKKSA
jgi:uncharacterized protein (DUF736 family)